MHAHAKQTNKQTNKSHTHVKNPVVRPFQSSVDYGNTKITLHTLKVSVFIMLKLDTIRLKKKQSPTSSIPHLNHLRSN